MSGNDYRESLRRLQADCLRRRPPGRERRRRAGLRPGLNAIALTYDYALKPRIRAADDGGAAHQRQAR